MANLEHVAILKEGVPAWNTWREEHPEISPDLRDAMLPRASLAFANLNSCAMSKAYLEASSLSGAHLEHVDLRGANLVSADLSGANMAAADLSNAVLFQAGLRNANLSRARLYATDARAAKLIEADLFEADLTVADLRSSDLTGASLKLADLGGANLTSAIVFGTDFGGALAWQTVFGDLDLSKAVGLDGIKHKGPSVIDVATLYMSRRGIPDSFLRGAGVPESLIVYVKSLTAPALEFYSCFISYSSKDQEFVDRLHSDLQARGIRCWFAPHDVRAGRKLHEQIDEAIRVYDRLLLVLSPHSMGSEWVKTEIEYARTREARERWQVLFPISLVPFDQVRQWSAFDAESGTDTAREIREYFIPDFSRWRDEDSYVQALSRLVRDLALSAAPGVRPGGQL